jgi:hypothetical protein
MLPVVLVARNNGQGVASVVQRIVHGRIARRESDEQRSAANRKENARLDQKGDRFRDCKTKALSEDSFHDFGSCTDIHINRRSLSRARCVKPDRGRISILAATLFGCLCSKTFILLAEVFLYRR